jgi:hypothetical protein
MIIQKYNYETLSRKTTDGRRHYCLPDGSKVPSVTTILDSTKPVETIQKLQEWRNRVGHQRAQEITTEAASRGTRMHKWLENYIKSGDMGIPGTNPFSKQSYDMANAIVSNFLSKNVNEYWGTEVSVYYSGLYAGTTDCVGVWKNQPAIIDFKQSNKQKKREWIDDYFLQLASYALAHNNTHDTKINSGVILMCTPDNQCQEFEISGEEFDHYTNRWLDRVAEYYLNN